MAAKSSSRVTCRKGAMDIGPDLAVKLLDVSESGVRLLLRVPLPVGQEVSMGLEGPTHGRPIKCSGHVTWTVETSEGHYCTGVHLDKLLAYRDLQLLANQR